MLNNECQDDVIACYSEMPREERQEKKLFAQYADRYSFFSDVFEPHLVKCKDIEPTGSEGSFYMCVILHF